MTYPDPRRLFREMAETIQWYYGDLNRLHANDPHREKVLRVLKELVSQFKEWERKHPNYRPLSYDGSKWGEGKWDVCAGLHLLKLTVELAQEVNASRRMLDARRKMLQRKHQRKQIEIAAEEATGRTHH
jgi:predicted translin family RNA/ssDNA-binding protein